MSVAGNYSSIYGDKIIPCPAWTGTYNASLYQSGGKSRKRRGSYRKRRSKRYGGFVPRTQNPRPKKVVRRRTKRNGGPKISPIMFQTPTFSTSPTTSFVKT
jgi:hypothetical protein